MFKPYESKPVTRMAFQIEESHDIEKAVDSDSHYFIVVHSDNEPVFSIGFKAYQQPVIGDWVVRLTDEDTYHCTDAVFRERNIVPD